jgi:hypothetical protein
MFTTRQRWLLRSRAHSHFTIDSENGLPVSLAVPDPEGVGWRYRLRPLTSAPATGLILKA